MSLDNLNRSFTRTELLAMELAENYFDASSFDIEDLDKGGRKRMHKRVFSDDYRDKKRDYPRTRKLGSVSTSERNELLSHSRNILVLGAGCTFNSFENIPLADKAIELLKRKVTIASLEPDRDISFQYFLDFYERFSPEKTISSYLEDYPKILHDKKFNAYLSEQLKGEYSLLDEIAKKYTSEVRKWNLIQNKDSHDPKVDFETFLNILGSLLPQATVRKALQDLYYHEDGPTLFYGVAAHMLKHRFIDVIINFNFDEILDRILLDEIGHSGVDMVVSDGDCRPLDDKLVKNGKLRQPIYVKPHGTASHKSTLRFTKDQYHEIPYDMREFLSSLVSGINKDGPRKRVNLITVGFDLNSIEFNEILGNVLPEFSRIFPFVYYKKADGFNDEKKRWENKLDRIFKGRNRPDLNCIGFEFTPASEKFTLLDRSRLPVTKEFRTLGNIFHYLFENVRLCFVPEFRPREIHRHIILSQFFGNDEFWKSVLTKEEEKFAIQEKLKSVLPVTYFKSEDYYRDRVLAEFIIGFAIDSGMMDLSVIMEESAGHYYSRYAEKSNINKRYSALALLNKFNLDRSKSDSTSPMLKVLKKDRLEQDKDYFEAAFVPILKKIGTKDSKLPFSESFKSYWVRYYTGQRAKQINERFRGLWTSQSVRVCSELRNNSYHVFEKFREIDLISTGLLCDILFYRELKRKRVDTLCLVVEQGYQLAKFLPEILEKNLIRRVYMIAHDENLGLGNFADKKSGLLNRIIDSNSDLRKMDQVLNRLDKLIQVRFLPVSMHNRHMTIFLSLGRIRSWAKSNGIEKRATYAMYYYKKGLKHKISPIRLRETPNLKILLEIFKLYGQRSLAFYGEEVPQDGNWIF